MRLNIDPSVNASISQPSIFPAPAARTAKARLTRLRHGLNSKYAVIPGEDEAEYQEFRHDCLEHLRPIGPYESGAAEQLILARWQLQRVWKIQTGVFERFEEATPAEGRATYPMRLAQCFEEDTGRARTLDKMSLHQVRLINIFNRCARLLMLSEDLREKGLERRRGRPRIKDEIWNAHRGLPAQSSSFRDEWTARPWSDAASGENADRRELPVDERAVAAAAPVTPAPDAASSAPSAAASAAPPVRATASSDAPSRQNADRRVAAAPTGATDVNEAAERRRMKELSDEYLALRCAALAREAVRLPSG